VEEQTNPARLAGSRGAGPTSSGRSSGDSAIRMDYEYRFPFGAQ